MGDRLGVVRIKGDSADAVQGNLSDGRAYRACLGEEGDITGGQGERDNGLHPRHPGDRGIGL